MSFKLVVRNEIAIVMKLTLENNKKIEKGCKDVNQFKEGMKVPKTGRSFYKVFEKGKDGKKVYKGSTIPELELKLDYLAINTVSCFVLNKKGEILVEERTANKNVMPGTLDIVSGHVDNNEIPTQAMIREYVEEIHDGNEEEKQKARNEASQNLQKLEELYLICDGRGYFIQFYYLMTELEVITKQKEEITKTRWLPMEEVFEMIRQGKTGLVYDKKIEKIFQQVRERYHQEKESKNLLTR